MSGRGKSGDVKPNQQLLVPAMSALILQFQSSAPCPPTCGSQACLYAVVLSRTRRRGASNIRARLCAAVLTSLAEGDRRRAEGGSGEQRAAEEESVGSLAAAITAGSREGASICVLPVRRRTCCRSSGTTRGWGGAELVGRREVEEASSWCVRSRYCKP